MGNLRFADSEIAFYLKKKIAPSGATQMEMTLDSVS